MTYHNFQQEHQDTAECRDGELCGFCEGMMPTQVHIQLELGLN